MHNTKLQKSIDQLVYGTWNGLARKANDWMTRQVKEHVWICCRGPVRDLIYGQVQRRIMDALHDDIGHAYEGGRPGPVLDNVARGTFVELVNADSPTLIIRVGAMPTTRHIRVGCQGQVHARRWNEDKGVYQYIVKFEGHSGPRAVEESALKRVV